MKSSDPKQLLILSVVAVGAVGFLGFTLFGAGQKVVSQMHASAERAAEEKPGAELSVELLRDPFGHPKLKPGAEESDPPPAADPAPAPPKQNTEPPALPGPTISPLHPWAVPGLNPSPAPAENAGPDRKEVKVQGPRVSLSAIVKVDHPMAFLSVNGGETRAFREGALVAPGLRLVSIQGGSVNIRTALKSAELKVGEEVSL